jgi:hypothetical protein
VRNKAAYEKRVLMQDLCNAIVARLVIRDQGQKPPAFSFMNRSIHPGNGLNIELARLVRTLALDHLGFLPKKRLYPNPVILKLDRGYVPGSRGAISISMSMKAV